MLGVTAMPSRSVRTTAYALGIINQNFFAILVMLALVTSWMAGTWLRYVLKRKRLMPGDEDLVIEKANEEVQFDLAPNLE